MGDRGTGGPGGQNPEFLNIGEMYTILEGYIHNSLIYNMLYYHHPLPICTSDVH